MEALETYLGELRAIRSTGAAVRETSYYPALVALLNEVGKTLKPKVQCILNPKNQGAGIPDGGLYEASQFQRGTGAPMEGQLPARGCVEVKGTNEDVAQVAASKQVQTYLRTYRQVLVTNYRSFLLVGYDENGKPVTLEAYDLAESEQAFWAASPRALAAQHGARFVEYLKRVMLHAAGLVDPEQVAWFLASYARDAKARIEGVELPALQNVRAALEGALGLRFEGAQGENFFRSTLVQTLFYGVFSAWVLWSKKHPPGDGQTRFDWRTASYELHVPMIRALFYQVASPQTLGQLGLVEVLDWTAAVLNRVQRAEFFARFEEGQAVQYFYEPFLQNFDPQLRKELGVWYTPQEIVQYMVARVDTVLREELHIADGLADERVYVLDPCCGTGAYLVEVLRHIGATLTAREGEGLSGHYLKEAATKRVFGFEILPAPFVVAHLQLGLLLQNLGAPLSDATDERVGVYLTNALTGWEPAKEPKTHLLFPELEAERDAAEKVKRETPILVILGNPPYNGFANVAVKEERDLSNAYRTTIKAPAPQGQGLNDLYVRFFRIAERRIAEQTGEGVVCFISNYSWLDGLSFTGMRERYLTAFDGVWIDSLNGDKYKTGKLTPEGKPDPSIFSTERNREGIQVGTAITLLVRKETHTAAESVKFRNLWGKGKREQLLADVKQETVASYSDVTPILDLGLPFLPITTNEAYGEWPLLRDLFPVSFPGVKTSRDDVVVDIDRENLIRRMEKYFDPKVNHEEMRRIAPGAMDNTARFDAESVRDYLRKRGFLPHNIIRYSYRPFDVRWLYWEAETKLLDEKRAEYFAQVLNGNICLVSQQKPRGEWSKPQVIKNVGCIDLMDRSANVFPLYIRYDAMQRRDLFTKHEEETSNQATPQPNLSEFAVDYLEPIGAVDEYESLFFHIVAILHAPSYRIENDGALRQDWPRVPLPDTLAALRASAALGRRIAALLDTEQHVAGVTHGTIDPFLRTVANVTRIGGGALNPNAGDLQLNAGWGHAGKGGVTMPGKGRLTTRPFQPAERAAMTDSPLASQLTDGDPDASLGADTHDVYLNDVACWQNVPARVWAYTIGGYQVMKKWLSYREHELLRRDLTADETREVMQMARRIAALCLLESALDDNYSTVKAAAYAWPATV